MKDDKKYQVFISSTYTDLIDARERAIKVILDLYHFPVGMEMFSADDDEQWKIIQDAIDVTDYYILIIGHRYGSMTDEGISYTEKEFDYAKSLGIPILSFIRDRKALVSEDDRESEPDTIEKLNQFIQKAKTGRVCSFWKELSDLEREIAIALPKAISRHQGIGWIRSNNNPAQIAEQLANLVEENRKLREENAELKTKAIERKPILKLSLDNISNIKLVPVPDELLFKKLSPINTETDIPNYLTRYVNYSSINDYNDYVKNLTDKVTDENNEILFQYWQASKNSYAILLNLENIGNAVANTIRIKIKFQNSLKIIDKLSSSRIELFKRSIISKMKTYACNPILYAEKNYRRNINENYKNNTLSLDEELNRSRNFQNYHSSNKGNDTNDYDMLVENSDFSEITIGISSLMHTQSRKYNNYILIPLEYFKGSIEVSVMCAEYLETENFTIPLCIDALNN